MSEKTKAQKIFKTSKQLALSKPVLGWLGDHTLGLSFDQYIRSLNSVCINQELDLDLRDCQCVQQTQQFEHEKSITKYADITLDNIAKMGVLSPDEEEKETLRIRREELTKNVDEVAKTWVERSKRKRRGFYPFKSEAKAD